MYLNDLPVRQLKVARKIVVVVGIAGDGGGWLGMVGVVRGDMNNCLTFGPGIGR